MSKYPVSMSCSECGKETFAKNAFQLEHKKFCSVECKYMARRIHDIPDNRLCERGCGSTLKRGQDKYCSKECFYNPVDLIKNCKNCNSEFKVNYRHSIDREKFCSKECRVAYQNFSSQARAKLREGRMKPGVTEKIARHGPDHWAWNPDRSALSGDRPQTERQRFRDAVLKRDGYKCVKCGASNVELHADHIYPYCLLDEECRWHVENGQTLCADCHRSTETYGKHKAKIVQCLSQ